jgi:hypothetical protein
VEKPPIVDIMRAPTFCTRGRKKQSFTGCSVGRILAGRHPPTFDLRHRVLVIAQVHPVPSSRQGGPLFAGRSSSQEWRGAPPKARPWIGDAWVRSHYRSARSEAVKPRASARPKAALALTARHGRAQTAAVPSMPHRPHAQRARRDCSVDRGRTYVRDVDLAHRGLASSSQTPSGGGLRAHPRRKRDLGERAPKGIDTHRPRSRRPGLHIRTGFARRSKVAPRRECNQMDERLKFIAQLLDGQRWRRSAMSSGSQARRATNRSRRPYHHANQLPLRIETLILRLKQDKPTWGAPKIREMLEARKVVPCCADRDIPVRFQRFPLDRKFSAPSRPAGG